MSVLPTANFQASEVHWASLALILIVLGGAVLGVLVEASTLAKTCHPLMTVLSILTTADACIMFALHWVPVSETPATLGEYMEDLLTITAQSALAIIDFFAVPVMADHTSVGDGVFVGQPSDRPDPAAGKLLECKGYQRSEISPLTLLSLSGMMIFPAADNFVMLLVALEVMSLPLYIMAATARRRRQLSYESALKYFVFGAFSSGFLLMSSASLFGLSNSLRISALVEVISTHMNMEWIVLAGMFCVMVGLLFKVGAAPFHAWTPDVYTDAPTPVTSFMAAAVRIVAFAATTCLYTVAAAYLHWDFLYISAAIAVLTILVGTFTGLVQDDVERMLAYSSISHVGFILMGILAIQKDGMSHVLFYTFGYDLATVGAFGVVALVRNHDADGNVLDEATSLCKWVSIGCTNSWIAGTTLVFLLSFAGVPLTGGFIGRPVVFSDVIKGGIGWLAVVGLVVSAIAAFYYFRLVRLMSLTRPSEEPIVVKSEGLSVLVIAACAIGTLTLDVFPGPALSLLEKIIILVL